MTIISGTENLNMARIFSLKAALYLETKGMKKRGQSAFSMVKREFGFKGSKQKVYDQLVEHVEKLKAAHAVQVFDLV